MQVILNVINSGVVVDNYDYSSEVFLHNGVEIEIKDKLSKLLYLVALTFPWQEGENVTVLNGYQVIVSIDNITREYFILDNKLEGFMIFIDEVMNVKAGEKE